VSHGLRRAHGTIAEGNTLALDRHGALKRARVFVYLARLRAALPLNPAGIAGAIAPFARVLGHVELRKVTPMNQLSLTALDAPHLTPRARAARHARRIVALALGALALGSSPKAHAQLSTIQDPKYLPDLTVSVSAPIQVTAYDISYVTFSVSNLAPTSGFFRAGMANDVRAHVDLTGLVPVLVQGAGGLQCSFSKNTTGGEWSTVDCWGSMAWGSTATIHVYFQPAQSFYCGRPTYTDAFVSYTAGGAERSSTNNRAIARTDLIGCIN
jgi:hypothetical protein